jgi:hypothetical protein
MKNWISIFLLCLPLLSHAQTDEKYLAGAVPTEDDKVVFRTDLQVSQLDKSELYRTALVWAGQRFVSDAKFNARVVYADTLDGKIAVYGDEYMVFSQGALSLDRTRVNYQFQMNVADGHCEAILSRIRYTYHDMEKNPDKYQAEEWITDEVALNKSKTKLVPICGKFRRKTVDLKDELFKGLQNAFGDRLIALGAQAAPVKPADLVTASTPIRRQPELGESVKLSEVATVFPADSTVQQVDTKTEAEAPVTRIPLTTELPSVVKAEPHHLTVTAGEDEEFRLMASSWGGESQMFGKQVAFLFVDTQKTAACLLLIHNEACTIKLYEKDAATPYTTLSGQKLSEQTIPGAEAVKMNAALDSGKSYNMFVFEIKNQ